MWLSSVPLAVGSPLWRTSFQTAIPQGILSKRKAATVDIVSDPASKSLRSDMEDECSVSLDTLSDDDLEVGRILSAQGDILPLETGFERMQRSMKGSAAIHVAKLGCALTYFLRQ